MHGYGIAVRLEQMTIVGVVKNHKYRSIDEDPVPMAWYVYAQIPVVAKMDVELRVNGEPFAILPSVRRVVQQIDPDLPLVQPMTQRAQYETTIARQLLFARLAGFFAILAVMLAGTGLYGTLVYRVNNRTIEIGVRMAMGAQRAQVVWMVLRDSLMLTALGAAIGVPFALLKNTGIGAVWPEAERPQQHGDHPGSRCARGYRRQPDSGAPCGRHRPADGSAMGIVYGEPSRPTGFRADSSLHWINRWTSLSRVRIEAWQWWGGVGQSFPGATWFEANPECSVTKTKR